MGQSQIEIPLFPLSMCSIRDTLHHIRKLGNNKYQKVKNSRTSIFPNIRIHKCQKYDIGTIIPRPHFLKCFVL